MAAYVETQSTATSKLAMATPCWEHVFLLWSADIRAEEARRWQHVSQVHVVTLMALGWTTLLDLHWVVHSNTARYAKRPSDIAQNVAHKRRKSEGLTE